MCGIAGYVQRASSTTRPIERMTARLAHRGPDGQGIWESRHGDWQIAFGHCRLSIIDPAHGHQPMSTPDGSSHITYNGEVYNFAALRTPLEAAGREFHTHCDTEVVLHHLARSGPDGLADLHGMFAFAAWDQSLGRLLVARDRVGIKPLYYAPLPDGGIAFASELAALLEHPAVNRELDPDGLASLFFLDYIHPPHTIVRGAMKLEPAHWIEWRDGELSPPRAYWSLDPAPHENGHPIDAASAAQMLRIELVLSVQSQLVSDVPLGVFLSGGIDSSLVAAVAQRCTRGPLKTFSIAFEDPAFDESSHARLVAKHIGSDHQERTLSESTLLDTLDDALDCLDEPIGDPSIVPTWLLSQLAAEHVKVALGGDGGDELWAGYPTYIAHRYAAVFGRIPHMLRSGMIEPLVRRLPVRHGYQSFDWKLKRFALRFDDRPLVRHLRWMSNVDLTHLSGCLTDFTSLPHSIQGLTNGRAIGFDLNRILAMDLQTYLPGAVLTKVDRASMAHGLEVRPPLLDDGLIDLAFSLPPRLKLHGRTTKALLKRVALDYLPGDIVHRRKKGFAIPLARWLNGPLRRRLDRVLDHTPLWDTGLLDRNTFTEWSREHSTGSADHSKPLWMLIVLDHWHSRLCNGFASQNRSNS